MTDFTPAQMKKRIKEAKKIAKDEGMMLIEGQKGDQIVYVARFDGKQATNADPMVAVQKMLDKMAGMDDEAIEAAKKKQDRKAIRAAKKSPGQVAREMMDAKLKDDQDEGEEQEADEGEEQDGEDDEPTGANVVPEKYRLRYKEASGKHHCGDWLANALDGKFDTPMGFDAIAFLAFLEANGVDVEGGWVSNRSRGWQGRMRMSGRLKLEIAVIKSGKLGKTKVPAEVMEGLLQKHPKYAER